jgi:long-chain acyl-CoA synthetase
VAGYNEGINTSAPLIYLMMKGQQQIIAKHVPLDFIPTDYVVAGMILALAELLEGTAKPVYQLGASDLNPCTAQRFGELVGLYKRKHYQRKGSGNPLLNALQARFEPTFVTPSTFAMTGSRAIASVSREVASVLGKSVPALVPAARALQDVARREDKIAEIQELFEPFTSQLNGPFDCSNTRAAYARLSDEDKAKLPWTPDTLDWADWMMNFHMPAMEKRIIPEMDRKLRKELAPLSPHATLVSLVDEMAERHDLGLALQHLTPDGLTRTSFRDVKLRSESSCRRATIPTGPWRTWASCAPVRRRCRWTRRSMRRRGATCCSRAAPGRSSGTTRSRPAASSTPSRRSWICTRRRSRIPRSWRPPWRSGPATWRASSTPAAPRGDRRA